MSERKIWGKDSVASFPLSLSLSLSKASFHVLLETVRRASVPMTIDERFEQKERENWERERANEFAFDAFS